MKNDMAKSSTGIRALFLPAGPVVCLVLFLIPTPAGLSAEAWKLTALVLWMVIWWISEVVPPHVTALLPVPMLPLMGIMDEKPVAASYAHPLIFLFMGGFMIASAMQRWGLHRRIALRIINATGSTPGRIIAGFMASTALLSMWISNTATAIMMFAVGMSVIEYFKSRGDDAWQMKRFGKALMLSIAYSASIGGVATLIGTPPNLMFAGFMEETYGIQVDFVSWMSFALPFSIVLLPLCWLWLTRICFDVSEVRIEGARHIIRSELKALGPMSRAERVVMTVFILTAAAWISRKMIVQWTGLELSDTAISLVAALVLFVFPVSLKRGEFALDWKSAVKLPWGVLLLFGGGLALAGAFQSTGLSESIGQMVTGLKDIHHAWLILLVAVVIVLLTELTSNTATAAAFLPVMGAVAVGAGINPMLMCVPVALAASMAFLMPVATPPNAIVFAYEDLTIRDMLRAGLGLAPVAIILIMLAVWFLGPATLKIVH